MESFGRRTWFARGAWFVLAVVGSVGIRDARAQLALGTGFTYQGSLADGGSPADGAYDFAFDLFQGDSGGFSFGTVAADDVAVVQGVFTVALDFGAVFDGTRWWLEIGVRPGADTGAYTTLSPRVELTAAPNALYAVRAGTAADADTVGGMDAASLSDDRAPVAVLEADAVVERSPLGGGIATLDLSLAYDPEGGPLEYGFDPEGTTAGEPSYGASATASHTFASSGTYLAEGWVRDASGRFDVDKALIQVVDGDAQTVVVDSSGGSAPSLSDVNGVPAIAFTQGSTGLRYARAGDPAGATWPPANIATVVSGTTESPSLLEVNGRPAIAYRATGSGTLVYARAGDADGATWPSPVALDTDAGNGASLVVVNGRPAISYIGVSPLRLRYVQASDADGAAWGTPLTVVSNAANKTAMAVVNGRPAIAFNDLAGSDLEFVRAADADGANWSDPPVAVDAADAGAELSLAIVNGNPAIAYYDATNLRVRFVRAADADGTDWSVPSVEVAAVGDLFSGIAISLGVVGGRPAIAYYDSTADELKYIGAADADGADWSDPSVALDSDGEFLSLAVVNGAAGVAYIHTDGVKYAR